GTETRLVDSRSTCWTEFWHPSTTITTGASRQRRSRARLELTLRDLPRRSEQRQARAFKATSTNSPLQQKSERSAPSRFVPSQSKVGRMAGAVGLPTPSEHRGRKLQRVCA